jgi:hypothetical protein
MAAKTLALDQMYRVLRGLPGTMTLRTTNDAAYVLTVVNPNAPANRCQETLGLSVTLEGPVGSSETTTATVALREEDLVVLRTGEPLALAFGPILVSLRSNPGGHLVDLGEDTIHAGH